MLIVALDFCNRRKTLQFLEKLDPEACKVKVGLELFISEGPELVSKIVWEGYDVFLDLKLHDIPNTVQSAIKAANGLGVWMINVHASGGCDMLKAARDAVDGPKLVAVTCLTSLDDDDMYKLGVDRSAHEHTIGLAKLAKSCGMDGVVCSPQDAAELRKEIGPIPTLVCPGIRFESEPNQDQKRIMTPERAMASGADYLVVGRPVTRADDPMAVIEKITRRINEAHSEL